MATLTGPRREPPHFDPTRVRLRTCPACRNEVSAENAECPRCGANFRAVRARRLLLLAVAIGAVAWVLNQYGFIHWW